MAQAPNKYFLIHELRRVSTPYRIVETYATIDGIRTRFTNKSFSSKEEGSATIKELEASAKPDTDPRPFSPNLQGTPLETALGLIDAAVLCLVDYGSVCLGTEESRKLIEARRLIRAEIDKGDCNSGR